MLGLATMDVHCCGKDMSRRATMAARSRLRLMFFVVVMHRNKTWSLFGSDMVVHQIV